MICRFAIFTLVATSAAIAPVRAEPDVAASQAVSNTTSPASSVTPTPLERATADAVARLYAQIAAERVDDLTVAHILERVQGSPTILAGLTSAEQVGGPRRVTSDFVQVQLQIAGPRAAELVMQAVNANASKSPIPPERLSKRLQAWSLREFSSTGDSIAPAAGSADVNVSSSFTAPNMPPAQSRPATALPDRAPSWAADPLVASATATPANSPLLTAREAERLAREQLRKRVEALRLDESRTLNDLARAHAATRDAISRALDGARIAGVDYRADGSVEVRIALDGQRLWQMLQLAR